MKNKLKVILQQKIVWKRLTDKWRCEGNRGHQSYMHLHTHIQLIMTQCLSLPIYCMVVPLIRIVPMQFLLWLLLLWLLIYYYHYCSCCYYYYLCKTTKTYIIFNVLFWYLYQYSVRKVCGHIHIVSYRYLRFLGFEEM